MLTTIVNQAAKPKPCAELASWHPPTPRQQHGRAGTLVRLKILVLVIFWIARSACSGRNQRCRVTSPCTARRLRVARFDPVLRLGLEVIFCARLTRLKLFVRVCCDVLSLVTGWLDFAARSSVVFAVLVRQLWTV